MNLERLQQLQKLLKEEPTDPFIVYAMAAEYRDGKPEEALKLYSQLIKEHPGYLPTYYQAATLHATIGNEEAAIRLFEIGITLAQKQGDAHTARELRSALDELTFE